MNQELVEKVLDRVRVGLKANDADLQLVRCEGGTVEVSLTFGPNSCLDCIVSHSVMYKMLEKALQQVPGYGQLILNDPRGGNGHQSFE